MEQKIQSMSMEQSFEVPNEQVLEKSIGNLFEEFLSSKNRLAEFDQLSTMTNVEIDGEYVRLSPKGFPALVKDILKMVVLPTQGLRFRPAVAGG